MKRLWKSEEISVHAKKSILDTQYGNVPNVHSDLWALAQKSLSVNTIFYAIQNAG